MAIQTIQLGGGGGGFVKAHGFAALSTNVYKSPSSVTGEEDITSDSPVVSIEGKGFLSHIAIPGYSIVNIVVDDNSKFKAYTNSDVSLININSPYIQYFYENSSSTCTCAYEVPGYTKSSLVKFKDFGSSSNMYVADSIMNGYPYPYGGGHIRELSDIAYHEGNGGIVLCGSRFYFTKSIKIYVRYYKESHSCKPVSGVIGLEV